MTTFMDLADAEGRYIGLQQDLDVAANAPGVRSAAAAVVALRTRALIDPPIAPAAIPGRRAVSRGSTAAASAAGVNNLALLVLTSAPPANQALDRQETKR